MKTHGPHSILVISVSALVALVPFAPAAAAPKPPAAPPRATPAPAPPCTTPSLPAPVATAFAQLGGIAAFGCPANLAGPVYVFRSGQIEAIQAYGSAATYAATVDASGAIHLFLSGTAGSYDHWLVRVSWDGTFVSQTEYDPSGSVTSTALSNILVHPGRTGTYRIDTAGCTTLGHGTRCVDWSAATLTLNI